MLDAEAKHAKKVRAAGHGYCSTCNKTLPVEVLKSFAGYYIGTWCDECGPYSRISGYYDTMEKASKALADGSYNRATGGE